MNKKNKSLRFYAPRTGITAELGSEGEFCWVRVQVEAKTGAAQVPSAVRIAILFQPRDEFGLPRGPACVLHQACWPLDAGSPATAFGWLPRGLRPRDMHQFYLRITPITMTGGHPSDVQCK